jgi:hypothetical protein
MLWQVRRGLIAGRAALDPPAGDPNFSNVKLLLGFEGADGATGSPGMTDESLSARGNATVSGNAQIDTAQFKFGAASLLLDGTGDKIAFADSADWELTGEFTIEAFIRANTLPVISTIAAHGTGSTVYGWWLSASNAGSIRFRFDDNGDATALHDVTSSTTISTGTWYHIAVDRDASNKIRLYIDGVMRGSKTSATGSSFNSTGTLDIGEIGSGFGFDGWIDEFRFTNVARYASDSGFTVPTVAFPRA